ETQKIYLQKLEDISNLQSTCSSSIVSHRRNLKDMSNQVDMWREVLFLDDKSFLDEKEEEIKTQENFINEMEAFLPKKNGLYLRLVIGNVNVILPNRQLKFAYKDEYEKFKLYLTVILLLLSFICFFIVNYRFMDAILNFLLVWYYSTLTIRETILIKNGSRIKGWWVFHHFISSFLSGQTGAFTGHSGANFLPIPYIKYLQYYYQSGCLYRLRALGERHNMDLTIEGFQSWMWKGLTFILPFLFFGHFWQLLNCVSLFRMALLPECKEWQVSMCGICFLVLFIGNFFSTLGVVHLKLKNRKPKPNEMLSHQKED
ncbi:hypothetical protein CCH79_00003705, partial [Gambusia affinis]